MSECGLDKQKWTHDIGKKQISRESLEVSETMTELKMERLRELCQGYGLK